MLLHDLITIALRHLEGSEHRAMGGIEQSFQLWFGAALDQVKANERHDKPLQGQSLLLCPLCAGEGGA
jgi:hypothetical protein